MICSKKMIFVIFIILAYIDISSSQKKQWIRLSICTQQGTYSVFPTGQCFYSTSGTYQVWSLVTGTGDPSSKITLEHTMYSDDNCTGVSVPRSIEFQKSCTPIIIPGSLDPVYDVLYMAEVLEEFPSVPKYGWIDKYYSANSGCSSDAITGFTIISIGICTFDHLGFVINYPALGISTSDIKLSNCGYLINYNSAEGKCVEAERVNF